MLAAEITRVVLLADHDGEGVGLEGRRACRSAVPCRRTAGLDRTPSGRRRRLQRPGAEAGRVRRSVRWSRPQPNGSLRRSHSRSSLRRSAPSSARTGRSAFALRRRCFPRCRPTTAQIAIHRTYLAPDGSGKADVPKPRMMLGSVAGGAVRLGQVGEHGVVGLAEGHRDGAERHAGLPGAAGLGRAVVGQSGAGHTPARDHARRPARRP